MPGGATLPREAWPPAERMAQRTTANGSFDEVLHPVIHELTIPWLFCAFMYSRRLTPPRGERPAPGIRAAPPMRGSTAGPHRAGDDQFQQRPQHQWTATRSVAWRPARAVASGFLNEPCPSNTKTVLVTWSATPYQVLPPYHFQFNATITVTPRQKIADSVAESTSS